ncbi:MAG: hypothetical protein AAF456_01145 [Planctomycetota bacterium]
MRRFRFEDSDDQWATPENAVPRVQLLSNGVRHVSDLSISKLDQWVFSGEKTGNEFELPFEFDFNVEQQWVDCIDIVKLGDERWVVTCKSRTSLNHEVVCFSATGSVLWSAEVKSLPELAFGLGGSGPAQRGFVQLSANDEYVVAFGVNGLSLYFEVFRIDTGNVVARFSTFIN